MRQSPLLIFIKSGLYYAMSRRYTTIAITTEVKEVLTPLKEKMRARNYDQVVRELLRRVGYEVP